MDVGEVQDMTKRCEFGSSYLKFIAAIFALVFLGLAIILVGAELTVKSSVQFASRLGVSQYIIGLTIGAIGTTVPDEVITVPGAMKGKSGIVLAANMIGSNIFNLLFVLGLAAFVQPMLVDETTLRFDVPVMVGITWVAVCLLFKQKGGRVAGSVLMTGYLAYLVFNFFGK